MAAIVEQYNDDKGIIWPINIAPYKVSIVIIDQSNEQQVKVGNNLYDELNKLNISTILDDRDLRPGVKFNDMDLIGIPIRITVGRDIDKDIVEFKLRDDEKVDSILVDNVINKVKEIIK
jgi:prolyl-tRNA synthetase